MGLKADIQEVVEAWPRWPWRLRVFLVLSLFLASSSIASLSETVFRWKGFVLDAVEFYRTYYAKPASRFAEFLFSESPQPFFIDTITLVSLWTAAAARVTIHRSFPVFPWQQIVGYALFLVGFALIYRVAGTELRHVGLALAIFGYLGLLFTFIEFERGASKLLGVLYLVLPPIIVGLLGAIAAGLARQ